jgi:aminobenzoyl-glutamate utilization protein B
MATPVAHKGSTAGAKALALTMLDVLLDPALVPAAWDYYRTVQTKDIKYEPFVRPGDQPATELNAGILGTFREQMKAFYYQPDRYASYLEQLGVKYPTLRAADGSCGPAVTP